MRKRTNVLPPPEHRRYPSPELKRKIHQWVAERERKQRAAKERATSFERRALDIVEPRFEVDIKRWCKRFTATVDHLNRDWESAERYYPPGQRRELLLDAGTALAKAAKALGRLSRTDRGRVFGDYPELAARVGQASETAAVAASQVRVRHTGGARHRLTLIKEAAAYHAVGLMFVAGKPWTTTVDGPYVELADLLVEVGTGLTDKSTLRQCRAYNRSK
jgi:hypothetical protein